MLYNIVKARLESCHIQNECSCAISFALPLCYLTDISFVICPNISVVFLKIGGCVWHVNGTLKILQICIAVMHRHVFERCTSGLSLEICVPITELWLFTLHDSRWFNFISTGDFWFNFECFLFTLHVLRNMNKKNPWYCQTVRAP